VLLLALPLLPRHGTGQTLQHRRDLPHSRRPKKQPRKILLLLLHATRELLLSLSFALLISRRLVLVVVCTGKNRERDGHGDGQDRSTVSLSYRWCLDRRFLLDLPC
jgi:hypothetical protein